MDAAGHKRTFHTLDALRGIGALLIVVHHAPAFFGVAHAGGNGVAVDLFFAMSGIVLSRVYDGRLEHGMGVFAFMRLRLIRLYPLYAVGLGLGALNAIASITGHGVIGWTRESLALAVLLGTLMLPGPSPVGDGRLFALNVPAWSLLFELVVNAAYAALYPMLTTRRLVGLCLACAPLLAAAAWFKGDLDRGVMAVDAPIALLRTVFSFSAGLVIARMTTTHGYRRSLPAFLAIVGTVALTLLVPIPSLIRPVWDVVTLLVGMPLVAFLAIRVEPPRWLVPACTAGGLASYAIYVVHVPIVALVQSLAGHFGGTWIEASAPVSGVALLVGLAVLGRLLDRVYDAPVRRMLLGKVRTPRATAAREVMPQPKAAA